MIYLIIIAILITIAITIYNKEKEEWEIRKQYLNEPDSRQEQNYRSESEEKEIIYPYQSKPLLTPAESAFYKYLNICCNAYNIKICPKVRMEDFIQTKAQNPREYYKFRGYIKSRHIDFLLCDESMNILCAIELDDTSHMTTNAQKTDEMKNEIYEAIGIQLFRVSTQADYKEAVKTIMLYTISEKRKYEPQNA